MAPRESISRDRLELRAKDAAQDAADKMESAIGVPCFGGSLTCRYVGKEGDIDEDSGGAILLSTAVNFQWDFTAEAFEVCVPL